MNLSIIIPSVGDPYLQKTLDDIEWNAVTEHEVIVIDGTKIGMRSAINKGVAQSKGKYIIKTDEHCTFDYAFDKKLLENIEDNWVVIPRRYKLDVEKWEVMKEYIDYERLILDRPEKIGGVRWPSRQRRRKDIMLDETMVFQGSFYLMTREHWDNMDLLQTEGYGEFANEAIEIALKTWLSGGKVMVNKNTWYAHKHRQFRRHRSPWGVKQGNLYSKDFWLNNRWDKRVHDLDWLMKRFGL